MTMKSDEYYQGGPDTPEVQRLFERAITPRPQTWILPVIITVPGRQLVTKIPEAKDLFLPTTTYLDVEMEGAAFSLRNAIVAAAAHPAHPHVLLAEDDVIISDELPDVLRDFDFPDGVGVASFCDMREMPPGAKPGIYIRSALGIDGNGWWGNQLLLIHSDVARTVAREDWFSPEVESFRGIRAHREAYEDGGRNCADVRMALLVHRLCERNLYAVHVPSLGFHVGKRSQCFPGRFDGLGERYTRNWYGEIPAGIE